MLSAEESLEIGARVWEQLRKRRSEDREAGEVSPQAQDQAPVAYPDGTLLIGECEDGLPFTLDLNDPRPGSLLIAGEAGCGKTALLASMLESAANLNGVPTPGRRNDGRRNDGRRNDGRRNDSASAQLAIYLISPEPAALVPPSDNGHLRQALSPQDPEIEGLLVALEGLVVGRQYSGDPQRGPAVVLAIDGLEGFLDRLDEESFARLHALTIHGPRARVWVVATLDAGQVDSIDSRILDGFRTRLLGQISSPPLAAYLAEAWDSGAELLEPGQFTVAFNGSWLRFRTA